MLSLLAHLYRQIIELRNRLYDKGVLDTFDLGVRTISIGNITTGGTGKTPLVAYVAGVLADRGEVVCILTRGYGRQNAKTRVLVSDGEAVLADAATGGDEPVELARKLIDKKVMVIADADRVAAAEWAKRRFGVTAFVLDDAFQHQRAKRNLDIVCVDATDPFGSGMMLPAGRLREPIRNLARADVVVITRADLVDDISDLRSKISDTAPDAAIFTLTGRFTNLNKLIGKRVLAFCGLGNPENFFSQLRNAGIDVSGTMAFADHHDYSHADAAAIVAKATANDSEILVTTPKDGVKLGGLDLHLPVVVADLEVMVDPPDEFETLF